VRKGIAVCARAVEFLLWHLTIFGYWCLSSWSGGGVGNYFLVVGFIMASFLIVFVVYLGCFGAFIVHDCVTYRMLCNFVAIV